MKESNIQTKIKHYVEAKKEEFEGGFEVKVVRTGNFHTKQLLEHQKNALKNLLTKPLYFKLSDADPRRKPFDFFVLRKGYSTLVVSFLESGISYFIDYEKIEKETYTEEELYEIAYRIVKL